ncbi:hypothetical protein RHGRI_017670 [Rhododendron griersonianum]|uniref:O-acyltransferase WSD1 C-terminal domain-containing protein n=1 Tax=Rhododendron griersonianum TaxID=479676 RepID=A0AAV6JYX1_9ERIC|nr:hypothetical protein RHGRI_017670 [Rhododendron griersonianum]
MHQILTQIKKRGQPGDKRRETMEYYSDEGDMPVSPNGQYFNSSVLSFCILGVLELEIPFDDSQSLTLFKNLFLPINPRFSSIMTINDVITGIIFLGTRLYMQQSSSTKDDHDNQQQGNTNATALVVLNTRAPGGYTTIEEMLTGGATDDHANLNPLRFVKEAHGIIKRKRNSVVYLTGWILEILRKFRGPEVAARYFYNTMKNSSIAMSNLIGPVEKMALASHPIKGLYFTFIGSPESLAVTIMSYIGELRITIRMEKGFMDPQKFNSCIQKAFDMMFKAAVQNTLPPNSLDV